MCLKGNQKLALSLNNLENQGHTFNWDHVEVVDTEARKYNRKVSEAIQIHIRLRNAKVYQQKGYDLPPIDMSLLRGEGVGPAHS